MIFKDLKLIGAFGYNYPNGETPFNMPQEWFKELRVYYTNYGRLYSLFGELLTEDELKIKIQKYYRKLKLKKLNER